MNYTVRPVSESAYQIIEHHPSCDVYLYLIVGSERALLIDTGYGTIPLEKVVGEITGLPVQVVLTHGHFDHIGGAAAFRDVCIHERDLSLYRSHMKSGDPAGVPALYPKRMDVETFGNDKTFDLGDRVVRVLPVPGHSKGCVCLYDETEKMLYTGDCCCEGDVLLNLENAGTVEEYLESVHTLQEFLREHNIEYTWPGHHACPVKSDIIDEFEEAARALIEGRAETKILSTPFGEARHVSWKRIGIWY